jgi:class 3 adenylate cyclase
MVKNQTAKEERRLTAIMFTDIVGYTAIMGKNEKDALQLLEKNLQLHNSEKDRFHGTILKIMDDGILVCFPSASEAIYCARALIKASEKITDFFLRIGIHEGEVTFKEGDVFGDGVNIASRIVNLAGKDEILISESI